LDLVEARRNKPQLTLIENVCMLSDSHVVDTYPATSSQSWEYIQVSNAAAP
jgi:hypothetical protein